MSKKIIFHHPLPLDKNAKHASAIRPIKMIEAFQKLGYEVSDVTGYGKERKEKIIKIKKRILAGEKFDFMYAESSTTPTQLTEKNNFPKYPLMDFDFFKFCKNRNIKIGLFYRDIYWRFKKDLKGKLFIKHIIAEPFFRYELVQYNKLVDIVYVPSMQMAKYVPTVKQSKFKALPPGHDEYTLGTQKSLEKTINLLYIGGLGSHYQMHKLFKVLENFPNFYFTLCTREIEWENAKSQYTLSNNINIVHKNGNELVELYDNADIAMLFVKPQDYREFAAPVKLFEYIGKEKPIIASKGTLAASFVEEHSIGWSIDYEEEALASLFKELSFDNSKLVKKHENIGKIKLKHTWEAKALQVEKDLIRDTIEY